MSYLVLARKYRPKTFEEVAGQEVATRTLQGAIREGRIGHAYLFSGPRGTGKTTSARIFAKALNCEQGPTPTPGGTCPRCLATDAGNEVDIIEIDAASNRGIDEARALREEVAYAPMNARFKVYIVDEVHMLTPQAFNALLKTLEEPPPHVKFLFATTEPHKVIETIRSRCQMVQLSLIDEGVIADRLEHVFAMEGVQPGEGVTPELARLARGSMRDGLSLADQLLALVGTSPTLEDVRRMSGPASGDLVQRLIERLEAHDGPGCLAALSATEGGETELLSGLLEELRLAVVCSLCPDEATVLVPDAPRREALAALGARLGPERIQAWLEELLHARERAANLPEHARTVLDVTLLDLAREETGMPLAELEARLTRLEQRLGAGGGAPPGVPPGPREAPAEKSVTAPPAAPPTRRPSGPRPRPASAPPSPGGGKRPGRAPQEREVEWGAPPRRPTAPPGENDPFTKGVADLFTGKIED